MGHEGSANILLVDADKRHTASIAAWLADAGYSCTVAQSGESALARLGSKSVDLIVCEIIMPGMSGIDLLTVARQLHPDTAIIMATGVNDPAIALTALDVGAFGYLIKPFDRIELLINVASALERRRLSLLARDYERELEAKVKQRTKEVREREEEIIFRLISAVGYRDHETGAHARRVGLYAAEVARRMGWDPELVDQLRLAAAMHDVGKIGIPDYILRKDAGLENEEFDILKKHTQIGAELLGDSEVPLIQMARDIALYHHERWDGSGYPFGLEEHAIPEAALIVAVVDVYDSMVHGRSYRPAFEEETAIESMIAGGGDYFGPAVFECFLELLPKLRAIREEVESGGATGEHPAAANEE